MTIIGKSKAACAMIFDIIKSNPFAAMYQVKIFNNLKLDGDIICESKKIEETDILNDFEFALGAVMPRTKRKLIELYNLTYQILVNKTAFISTDSKIGSGSMIDGLVYISSGVQIGKYVTVYSMASIAHDAVIGDFVTVCPNSAICGNVKIGEGTFIGAGSIIKNEVTIGKNCVIGAGSVVLENVPDGETVYGNPAKVKSNHLVY
jgi:sugar O-acyltransferase (sialic acid O-acetyltransferase NeuD family)